MMRRSAIRCPGWAPARQVRQRSGEDYTEVPQVELSDDERLWPPPTNRGPRFWWPADAHHVGILTRQRYQLPIDQSHSGVVRVRRVPFHSILWQSGRGTESRDGGRR